MLKSVENNMKHQENAESDSATTFYTHNIEAGGEG